jgi:hypothetical protein
MQINLRKANAVQSEIKKSLSGVRLETSVTVTEFTDNVEVTVNKAATDLDAALNQKLRLIGALFEIRTAVGRANATAGINDTLTAIEQIDQEMSVVSTLIGLKPRTPLTEINARIEKAKANTSERVSLYGDRLSSVETVVVYQERIDAAKVEVKQMKRAKQVLQDKLLQLNVNTLIELSAGTAEALKDEGIL